MAKKLILIISLASVLASCSTQRVILNDDHKKMNPRPAYSSQFQPFFAHGIGQERETDADEICDSPEKIHNVFVKDTFLDILIRGSFVFTPRAVRVYCTK